MLQVVQELSPVAVDHPRAVEHHVKAISDNSGEKLHAQLSPAEKELEADRVSRSFVSKF